MRCKSQTPEKIKGNSTAFTQKRTVESFTALSSFPDIQIPSFAFFSFHWRAPVITILVMILLEWGPSGGRFFGSFILGVLDFPLHFPWRISISSDYHNLSCQIFSSGWKIIALLPLNNYCSSLIEICHLFNHFPPTRKGVTFSPLSLRFCLCFSIEIWWWICVTIKLLFWLISFLDLNTSLPIWEKE